MLSILPLIVFLVKSAAADVLFVGLNERKAAMQEGDALFVVGGKHVYLYYLFDKLQYQNPYIYIRMLHDLISP